MDEQSCEVCTEPLDATDSSISFCDCSYALCLWCFHRICEDAGKDNLPARCPNCRSEYDQERIRKQRLDPAQLEEVRRKQLKKEEKRKVAPVVKNRKDLVNVRVVQRNLVYVVGLAMELCHEDVLKGPEYFGQFGKVVKISVSRGGPYGTPAAKNGPTGSAYITYKKPADAKRCIETVHGLVWGGKAMKACYGTTKYCNAFLKGLQCNNADCLYLHDVADEEDSYTKEETKTPKFVNLVHAASIQKQASLMLQTQQSGPLNGGTPRGQAVNGTSVAVSPDVERLGVAGGSLPDSPSELQAAVDTKHGWPALGGAGWAAAAKAPVAPVQQPPPPPPPVEASMQEWPELPGASSADVGEVMRAGVVAPVAPVAAQLQRKGSTMAAELARAASAPQGAAAAAKEPAGRPTSGNTVLVVPKKKQAPVAGGKTPKKATGEAGAAAAKQQDPTRAADERTSTSTPSVEAPDAPSQAAVAAVQKAVEDDVRKIEAGATTHEQPSKSEHGQREEVIVAQAEGSKPDEGLVWVDNSKPKVPKAGPPPGFDGAAKANGRPKKGPPPGFANLADQPFTYGSSGSPFQSYGSEASSTTAHLLEQQSPAAAGTATAQAQEPDIANKLPNLDSIFGSSDLQSPVDMVYLHPSNRSRSRFPFAQDGSNAEERSSTKAAGDSWQNRQAKELEGGMSLFSWLPADDSHSSHAFPGQDAAGMALLRQLQGGGAAAAAHGANLNGYGAYGYSSQFSGFNGFSTAMQNGKTSVPPPQQPPPQQPPPQQQAGVSGPLGFATPTAGQYQLNGFHHQGANGLAVHHAPPMPPMGQDAQTLEARWLTDNFRNMAV